MPCLLKIFGTKNMLQIIICKINRYRMIIPFLPIIQPTIWCFEFCNTQCFCEFQGFLFYYTTVYRYFLASFSDKPVVYFALSTFSKFQQRVFFREEFLFSNEAVNFCLFLTHVETVFHGTSYFAATPLFDNSFSKSFKALHF